VSRVLGVTNIGICNFVDSIINYFVLFSMMGVSILGTREIATHSGDSQKQGKVFSSLFVINGIATLIMLAILLVSIYVVPEFREYKDLMYIGAAKLVANLFLVEWFFRGTENFKYITKRTIFVKCLYVASVFIFVKTADDYPIYFLLVSMMVIVNAAINFPYACSKIKFSLSEINIVPHIKPFFTMGCYMLLTSMYTSFNVAYLGFVSTPEQVGYYTTATKIFGIILAIYSAFTGVMMPRMSALYAEGNIDEFKRLINKSIQLLFSFAIPAVIFTMIYAPEIIYLISGDGYEGAYLPARIIMPLILIIGYEQVLVIQILMPTKQDKAILTNSILGATVGVIANLIFATHFQSSGSAIVWILSEVTVLFSALYAVNKLIELKLPLIQFVKTIAWYMPIVAICIFVRIYLSESQYFLLLFGSVIMGLYTFFILYFIEKNQFVRNVINKFKS
jgi:O-antigen/teichoic acid export membrane protein